MPFRDYLDLLKTYDNRLRAGQFRQGRGIAIGILLAIVTGGLGFLLGILLNGYIPAEVPFQTEELHLVWGVHATVASLSLVGLSFGWNSIRNLPTTRDIIDEITFRLRSLETISYLLASNLCIGTVILFSEGEFVSPGLSWAVGFLLLGSFSIVVIRFKRVLELLLHNSLDSAVSIFAEDSLTGKSGRENQDYTVYVSHFLSAAQRSIDKDRPEKLRENLKQIEDLMVDLLSFETGDEERVWDELLGDYTTVHRWSIKEQNKELEKKVISSLHGLDLIISNYNHHNLEIKTTSQFSTLFAQGFDYREDPAVEHLLDRFEYSHNRVLGKFEAADSPESLTVAETFVDNLFETHTVLWRNSVEYESRKGIDYLEYLFDDVHQFRSHKYRGIPGEDPEDTFQKGKQEKADSYRNEVSLLKFASYGWGLRIYDEGELSEDFLRELFSKLEINFRGPRTLSEIFVKVLNEEEYLRYWERWNLERELEQSHGPAMTGRSVNTWLLKFYCVALIWYLDEKASESLPDPEDSPFVEESISRHYLDGVIDVQKSLETGYPVGYLIESHPDVEERVTTLVEHFENIKDILIQQEVKEIRDRPISNQEVNRFQEHVDEQLNKCGLRSGIEYIYGISKGDNGFDSFTYSAYNRRQIFVNPDKPTHFTSTLPELFDQYREFVLDRLELERYEVKLEELPDTLQNISADVIVVDGRDTIDALREDDRSESAFSPEISEILKFDGVPVLRDNTESFDVACLLGGGLNYLEPEDQSPISVEVIPGEDLDDFDPGRDPNDFVKVDFTYRGKIESFEQNGVLFEIK